MVAFDAVGVVSRFVFTVRTGDQVRRSNTGLSSRQIRKENVFRLAVLAGIQQIPLSGGKSAHVFNDSLIRNRKKALRETNPSISAYKSPTPIGSIDLRVLLLQLRKD
jgi:hypothetical protein